MPREEPIFRKCCYCIPLQSCLQIWSTIKVLADIGLSFFLLMLIVLLGNDELKSKQFSLAHAFIIFIVMLGVDGIFMMVLSVGLCKKNVRSLRVFYFYSLYMAATSLIIVIALLTYGYVCDYMRLYVEIMIAGGVGGFINTALDVAIILTLKSEIIKLRNKQLFEFVKMPTLKGEDQSELEEE